MKRALPMLAIVLALVTVCDAHAETRLYLASQYDFGRKLGFFLDFEGSKLKELPVILGVADGTNWRFDRSTPGFVPGRQYAIRGLVTPERSQLFVDGKLVAESTGAWAPMPGPLMFNEQPGWASALGDWVAEVDSISVAVSRYGREVARQDYRPADAGRSVALRLFAASPPGSGPLATQAGDTVTVDVSLRFASADLRNYAPLVDQYGQCRYADWPEKVRTDQELAADVASEDAELARMPPSPDYDRYGGYLKAGWKEAPSGFFRVLKRDGYWWLITPDGNPCFYLGVCSVPSTTWDGTPISDREYLYEWLPPDKAPWTAARSLNNWGTHDNTQYVCFYAANLIRKYGAEGWQQSAEERAVRRFRAWGFSGVAKWGGQPPLVSIPVLHRWGVPDLVRHPDVFDPKVCETFRKDLEGQIAPHLKDPTVLGWSLGNEYDEIVTPDEVKQVLAKPADTPAKRALLDYAVDKLYGGSVSALAAAWKLKAADRDALYAASPVPPGADLEKLRCYCAESYYKFIYTSIKSIDSNHLYLGFWIVPGWWVNETDWRLITPYCDVIGYDRYSRDFADAGLSHLMAQSDKPVLCGEFSFPPFYDGARGFGRYGTFSRDDAEAGALYGRWVAAAAKDPYCVGLGWFEWHDQPLTGRGPGRGDKLVIGEDYAFGLLTETDRPKWDLVRAVRQTNLQAAQWRLNAGAVVHEPPAPPRP
jgi:hypothetical protein